MDIDESSYVVGEEEAVWLLKLVLPSLNEFLLKVRALFTGDPGTTMKVISFFFFPTIWYSFSFLTLRKKMEKVDQNWENCSWLCCCLFWPGVAAI